MNNINTNAVIWKKFRNSYYEVSNTGLVRSLYHKTPIILTPIIMANGYCYVSLYINKKYQKFRLHRVVMECFHGPSELTVDHINGVKTDNRLENLRYCSLLENIHNPITMSKIRNRKKSNK